MGKIWGFTYNIANIVIGKTLYNLIFYQGSPLQYQFSKMQHQSKAGSFLAKLQFLLSNQQYSEVIRWQKQSTMIDILSEEKMEKEIIPLYFRHQKFESFVRQLNLYGFKKVKYAGRHRFTHPNLLKGQNLQSITSLKSSKANKNDSKEKLSDHNEITKSPEYLQNSCNAKLSSVSAINSITQNQNHANSSICNTNQQQACSFVPINQWQPSGYHTTNLQNYWNMLMMPGMGQYAPYLVFSPLQAQH